MAIIVGKVYYLELLIDCTINLCTCIRSVYYLTLLRHAYVQCIPESIRLPDPMSLPHGCHLCDEWLFDFSIPWGLLC